MTHRPTRRSFLKASAVTAGALAGSKLVTGPSIVSAQNLKGDKIRVAMIGCGGQGGGTHIPNIVQNELLVAVVDPDPKRTAFAIKRGETESKKSNVSFDGSKVKLYNDYRKLFDDPTAIDAVHVATPNHHHALPALIAMSLGKHCYVEKPLAHFIGECRRMAEFAAKYKVITQMGNQGHSQPGYPTLVEYINAGAIGNVTEAICWTDRSNGGVGGQAAARLKKAQLPPGMNWDAWIGPAPFRTFHADLHPHEWHNWFDFGNGSPGNMACHIMDGAYWALEMHTPTSVVVEELTGGSDEQYPIGTRIRYDFPARGKFPAGKLYWYDGVKPGVDRSKAKQGQTVGSIEGDARNRPPIVTETEKKYNRRFQGDGSFYIGDKGIMHTDCYGGSPRIIPEEQHKAFPKPPETLPRWKGNHFTNFYHAIRTNTPAASDFSYAAKFAEMVLLTNLAVHAGLNQKIEWDGQKVTNRPELNAWIMHEYRQGWSVI